MLKELLFEGEEVKPASLPEASIARLKEAKDEKGEYLFAVVPDVNGAPRLLKWSDVAAPKKAPKPPKPPKK